MLTYELYSMPLHPLLLFRNFLNRPSVRMQFFATPARWFVRDPRGPLNLFHGRSSVSRAHSSVGRLSSVLLWQFSEPEEQRATHDSPPPSLSQTAVLPAVGAESVLTSPCKVCIW